MLGRRHVSPVEARIECHADPFRADVGNPLLHRIGIAYRDAADDDALDARIEQPLYVLARAHAPARLHAQAPGARDRLDHAQILECTRTRPVEIDEVQPARARVGVVVCERHRIAGIARLLRVVALLQANDAARAQVDGGDYFHGKATTLNPMQ